MNAQLRPNASRSPSTPHQRLYIRCLMQRIELDNQFITLQTLRYFDLAGIKRPREGARLDEALAELTKEHAQLLIGQLKKDADE